jgi:hypothetical protein
VKVGTIFIWEDYPHPRQDEPKNNWFLFLGTSGLLDDIPTCYFHRFTSQVQYYDKNQERANHIFQLFLRDKFQSLNFEKDSILDFNEPPYAESEEFFRQFEATFDIRGILENDVLKAIYNKKILISNSYSHKIKMDIHRSLNDEEITGLDAPIRRRSRRNY